MKIKFALFFIMLPALFRAQSESLFVCGMEGSLGSALQEKFRATKEQFYRDPQLELRSVQYVPIVFHIVRKTDGTAGASESDILDQLCDLNNDFAEMNIQFYLKDGTFNYINNSSVYSNHVNTINSIMSLEKDGKALNIFLVENATPPSSSGPGITLGYYYPVAGKDWVVIRDKEMEARNTTLAHEIGHYFSLPHPHFGWESDPWTLDKYGTSPAPASSPLGQPTEKMDGSNCETAGDEVCDTPPDYNGFGWPDCEYTLPARDPDSVLIDPEERLIMSYFLNCRRDDYNFSPMQQEMILTNLASTQRTAIRNTSPTNTTILASNTQLVSPIGGQTLSVYDEVALNWTAVEGADFYMIEIDGLPTFSSIGKKTYIISSESNSLTLNDLSPGKLYFWRVRPYNSLSTCQTFTVFQSFKTGLSTATHNQIPEVNSWKLGPNPLYQNEQVGLEINSSNAFEGQITWFDTQGRQLAPTQALKASSGKNQWQLSIPQNGTGIYFFVLHTEKGRISRKLMVME